MGIFILSEYPTLHIVSRDITWNRGTNFCAPSQNIELNPRRENSYLYADMQCLSLFVFKLIYAIRYAGSWHMELSPRRAIPYLRAHSYYFECSQSLARSNDIIVNNKQYFFSFFYLWHILSLFLVILLIADASLGTTERKPSDFESSSVYYIVLCNWRSILWRFFEGQPFSFHDLSLVNTAVEHRLTATALIKYSHFVITAIVFWPEQNISQSFNYLKNPLHTATPLKQPHVLGTFANPIHTYINFI